MTSIDLQLDFQDNRWHCYNEQIDIYSDELTGLDKKIKNYLTKTYQQGQFKIKYYFDFDNFPLWMRQYMPHYFNREIIYELKATK